MVASKLLEVTSKGTELIYGSSSSGHAATASTAVAPPAPLPPPIQTTPSTNDSTTCSSYLSPYFSSSSYWNYASDSMNYATESTYMTLASMMSSLYSDTSNNTSAALGHPSSSTSFPSSEERSMPSSPLRRWADRRLGERGGDTHSRTPVASQRRVSWDVLTKNPYNVVRGRQEIHHRRQSMSAVRSFLALVPLLEDGDEEENRDHSDGPPKQAYPDVEYDPAEETLLSPIGGGGEASPRDRFLSASSLPANTAAGRDETASQVAEGTLRALRDLALEEALELNSALRFWSNRWERPILSWVEAGPVVWTSENGYNHRLVGERVAQLQAVLARRCAAIGALQQHLLKAGWQRGVAQWGVLTEWGTVAGVDGSMPASLTAAPRIPPPLERADRSHSMGSDTQNEDESYKVRDDTLRRSSSHVGNASLLDNTKHAAHVYVRKGDGEGMYVEHPSFLAEWSVGAIGLVRDHLDRAANGTLELPCAQNWVHSSDEEGSTPRALPLWASEVSKKQSNSEDESGISEGGQEKVVKVTDLPLMMNEVSELLNVMDNVMVIQRHRRLDRLRPAGWVRRNWYILASAGPAALWLVQKGYIQSIVSTVVQGIRKFIQERLKGPVLAIIDEITKGRESFSDKKARMDAMETLKTMIRSWLDEMYPTMPESQRASMARNMDISLIERKKEESMKTFYEINNVVRMSFIEMQYMKKEMMNALHAMDEVMSANDINMNLAAITPVVIFAYVPVRVCRFLYYALLKLGRSREETFAEFRTILTDIERLLVMRDNPPDVEHTSQALSSIEGDVLGADDLGMLMLLIHELRTILWRERRRFEPDVFRGVSEDLAELAGERGAVSVRQQLQILGRMGRTYSFLKVLSTGLSFQYSSW